MEGIKHSPALPRSNHRVSNDACGLRNRRSLAEAMEQQMWLFGCDAACADGNLLLRYGFERHVPAQPRGRSSCYRFRWRAADDRGTTTGSPARPLVNLHGWCAGLHTHESTGEGGFLYIRAGNRLGWFDAPEPPLPGDYDDQPAARRALRLLGRDPESGFRRVAGLFLRWLEEYEDWIEASCGSNYRRRCFERAPMPWLRPEEGRAWLINYREALATPVIALPNAPSCTPR